MFSNETTSGRYDKAVTYGGGNVVSLYIDFEYKIKGQMFKETIVQRYMHLNQSLLENGTINENAIIAKSGNTGNSKGAHLHIDVFSVNKSPWLELLSEKNNFKALHGRLNMYDPEIFLKNRYKWGCLDAEVYGN